MHSRKHIRGLIGYAGYVMCLVRREVDEATSSAISRAMRPNDDECGCIFTIIVRAATLSVRTDNATRLPRQKEDHSRRDTSMASASAACWSREDGVSSRPSILRSVLEMASEKKATMLLLISRTAPSPQGDASVVTTMRSPWPNMCPDGNLEANCC